MERNSSEARRGQIFEVFTSRALDISPKRLFFVFSFLCFVFIMFRVEDSKHQSPNTSYVLGIISSHGAGKNLGMLPYNPIFMPFNRKKVVNNPNTA